MSDVKLTDREQEYLDCETPMLTAGNATIRILGGMLASVAQSIAMPSGEYGKADRKLMRTAREIKYTRYKKAVIRKRDGNPAKNDANILAKLNKNDFILAEDTYDPDEYTKKLYEEYMKKHGNK